MMFMNALRRLSRGVGKDSQLIEKDINFRWVTRSFVLSVVFIASTVGPAIGALIYSFSDQTVRNIANRMTGGPDLFQHISLSEEQYKTLPMEWRQTLAEVVERPKNEALDTKRIVEILTVKDIELIGRLAPFLVFRHIARDERLLSEHPIPGVSYEDMRRLEEIGIVDDVNFGMFFQLKSKGSDPTTITLLGNTVLIEATGPTRDIESRLELTRLTVAGYTLLKALRVPSNLEYFEWIAKRLEKDGWTVRLIAIGTAPGQDITIRARQAVIGRNSIANWGMDLRSK